MLNINEIFPGTSLDTTIWGTITHTTNGSADAIISVVSNACTISCANSWSGGAFYTKTRASVSNMIIVEYDYTSVGIYHYSSAGVNPYVGLVGISATRDTVYYNELTSKSIGVKADNSALATAFLDSGDTYQALLANHGSTTIAYPVHVKFIYDPFYLSFTVYINNSTTPSITSTLTSAQITALGATVAIEFHYGNYLSGHSGTYSNIKITENTYSAEVTSITLNKSTSSIVIGSTDTLTASFLPIYTNNRSIIWSSSNPMVASVNSSGVITALALGTAIITATSADGNHTSSCVVTIITIYTFTNCSAAGRLGPTQTQINAAYPVGNNLNGLVTSNNGIQVVTLPKAVYKIETWGSRGSAAGSGAGYGAYMSGNFDLNSNNSLNVLVGQIGTTYNGAIGGGGGGGTFVATSSNAPLIVAGGGGAGGGYYNGSTWTMFTGASAGITNLYTDGRGSTYASGFYGNATIDATCKSFINGGIGGTSSADGGFGGGATGTAGGNNYYGGSGGGFCSIDGSGYSGAGGGSYNAGASQINTAATSVGVGKVVITTVSTNAVTSVTLNKSMDYVASSKTNSTLVATTLPLNSTNTSVTWSSSNTSIATVNSITGLITGVALGTANIIATTVDGGFTAACAINVIFPLQDTLTIPSIYSHTADVIISGNIVEPNVGGMLQYQVLVNGIQIYPASSYTAVANTPLSVNYYVLGSLLNLTTNTILINYKDSFGINGYKSFTTTKTNTNPLINNMQVTNGYLTATISDAELDTVQYKILINGVQKYPITGYSKLITAPYNIDYFINRADVLLNVSNTITIQLLDILGGSYSQTINFTGNYIGLMFTDALGTFYTSDIGILLKYLDFGKGTNSVILGQTTDPKQVFFKNQYGYTIKNIAISIQNNLPNVVAQLSLTNSPFVPISVLNYNKVYDINSTDSFYVRLITTLSTTSTNGTIGISITATR